MAAAWEWFTISLIISLVIGIQVPPVQPSGLIQLATACLELCSVLSVFVPARHS